MRGITLAKAYVQVLPSTENIKGSLVKVMNPEADSAGKSAGLLAGQKLAAFMKSAIVVAGIGKALASSITEGAAVQQSLGGVETLFKDSADKVKANAQNAYKTAGMSANQYMETVTGFSASLLQGLGGDTAKAADVADMALTDMADNANKMGTSMELIQNAYQGFAKQNYTMLDNLKLGYGGTQAEMQRLLADAEKISGVKYDITNLSDVYSAIHVIQEEMGIAGTTALEASSTFNGSFAAMKAAAQTFLGNLALGEAVWPSFVAMLQTTETFLVNNFLPMLGNVVTGIAEVIRQTAKTVLQSDGSVVNSIIKSINTRLPGILQRGVAIITNIANGILRNLPRIIQVAGTTVSKFVSCVIQNLPTVLAAGVKLIINLVNGVINNLPRIVSSAFTIVSKLRAAVWDNAPRLISSGIALIGRLAAGLIKAVPNLISKIPSIISSVKENFFNTNWGAVGLDIIDAIATGIVDAGGYILTAAKEAAREALQDIKDAFLGMGWDDIGANLTRGIANGIVNGGGLILSAAKDAAVSALTSAKQALGIRSPSTRGEKEVGAMLPAGIARGVIKNTNAIKSAMKAMSEETLGVAKNDYKTTLGGLSTFNYQTGKKEQSADIAEAIRQFGDKQARAIERGLSNMKWTSNNRELARFLTELGFVRG